MKKLLKILCFIYILHATIFAAEKKAHESSATNRSFQTKKNLLESSLLQIAAQHVIATLSTGKEKSVYHPMIGQSMQNDDVSQKNLRKIDQWLTSAKEKIDPRMNIALLSDGTVERTSLKELKERRNFMAQNCATFAHYDDAGNEIFRVQQGAQNAHIAIAGSNAQFSVPNKTQLDVTSIAKKAKSAKKTPRISALAGGGKKVVAKQIAANIF